MKAFLDTNIYLDHYKKGLHYTFLHNLKTQYRLYLHIVVLAELFSGAKSQFFLKELKKLEKIFETTRRLIIPIKRDYLTASTILQRLKEDTKLFNDALLASSCRHEGITLVTTDKDFKRIKQVLPFNVLFV